MRAQNLCAINFSEDGGHIQSPVAVRSCRMADILPPPQREGGAYEQRHCVAVPEAESCWAGLSGGGGGRRGRKFGQSFQRDFDAALFAEPNDVKPARSRDAPLAPTTHRGCGKRQRSRYGSRAAEVVDDRVC